MLAYVLYGLMILACVVLVVAVLLQPGKADAQALFTSSISSTAFGPRGTQTILAKITIGAAAVFMLAALMLSLPGVTGPRSVLQTVPETPAQPSPAAPSGNASPQTEGQGTTAPATTETPAANTNEAGAPTPAANSNQGAASPQSGDGSQPQRSPEQQR